MRRKALLAVLSASAMVNLQVPATGQEALKSARETIENISLNAQMTHDLRAYFLLSIALSLLSNEMDQQIREHFNYATTEKIMWSAQLFNKIVAHRADSAAKDFAQTDKPLNIKLVSPGKIVRAQGNRHHRYTSIMEP